MTNVTRLSQSLRSRNLQKVDTIVVKMKVMSLVRASLSIEYTY